MLCPVCVANASMAVAGATTGAGITGILGAKFGTPAVRAIKASWRQIRSIVAMLCMIAEWEFEKRSGNA